jgi:hypothetical protein
MLMFVIHFLVALLALNVLSSLGPSYPACYSLKHNVTMRRLMELPHDSYMNVPLFPVRVYLDSTYSLRSIYDIYLHARIRRDLKTKNRKVVDFSRSTGPRQLLHYTVLF